ncbi:thiamine pyrophosphate-binding protein [Pelagibaculum spongiae]|nr:thiamine pyrophosphate-binding protein [Pelagibaculum spongiae]
MNNTQASGASIIARLLAEIGASHIFVARDEMLLPITKKLSELNIQLTCVDLSRTAVLAAEGWARFSGGQPGVVLIGQGSKVTEAITGIASASADSIPLVVISLQVPLNRIGTDANKELDTVGITRSCSKHNYLVRSVDELSEDLAKAFHIARTGRPGPVVVDVPINLLAQLGSFQPPMPIKLRSYNPPSRGHLGQLKKALRLLLEAKKPLLCLGGGVAHSGALADLSRLAKKLNLPVVTTLSGAAICPNDLINLGLAGEAGSQLAKQAVNQCDVFLACGVRFDWRLTGDPQQFCRNASIIHIDVDPTSISRQVRADVPVVGTLDLAVRDLLELLDEMLKSHPLQVRTDWPPQLLQDQSQVVTEPLSNQLVEMLSSFEASFVIAVDPGPLQQLLARDYIGQSHHQWLTSSGLSAERHALPAAIGAAKAGKSILVLLETSQLAAHLPELMLINQLQLDIKLLCLDLGESCRLPAICRALDISATEAASLDEVPRLLNDHLLVQFSFNRLTDDLSETTFSASVEQGL